MKVRKLIWPKTLEPSCYLSPRSTTLQTVREMIPGVLRRHARKTRTWAGLGCSKVSAWLRTILCCLFFLRVRIYHTDMLSDWPMTKTEGSSVRTYVRTCLSIYRTTVLGATEHATFSKWLPRCEFLLKTHQLRCQRKRENTPTWLCASKWTITTMSDSRVSWLPVYVCNNNPVSHLSGVHALSIQLMFSKMLPLL